MNWYKRKNKKEKVSAVRDTNKSISLRNCNRDCLQRRAKLDIITVYDSAESYSFVIVITIIVIDVYVELNSTSVVSNSQFENIFSSECPEEMYLFLLVRWIISLLWNISIIRSSWWRTIGCLSFWSRTRIIMIRVFFYLFSGRNRCCFEHDIFIYLLIFCSIRSNDI